MSITLRREPAATLFDEFFNDFFTRTTLPARGAELPSAVRARMDVIDKGDRFEVLVDLPGVKKDDIQVNVDGARVSVSAETKGERVVNEGDRVLHTERYATSYARSFELPAEVSQDSAEAAYENGVLRLALPKRAQVLAKRLAVR